MTCMKLIMLKRGFSIKGLYSKLLGLLMSWLLCRLKPCGIPCVYRMRSDQAAIVEFLK